MEAHWRPTKLPMGLQQMPPTSLQQVLSTRPHPKERMNKLHEENKIYKIYKVFKINRVYRIHYMDETYQALLPTQPPNLLSDFN